jgi:hypothetical protein
MAVLVALLFKLNAGYAMFVAPPYRVEISLNAFIVFAFAAFVVVHLPAARGCAHCAHARPKCARHAAAAPSSSAPAASRTRPVVGAAGGPLRQGAPIRRESLACAAIDGLARARRRARGGRTCASRRRGSAARASGGERSRASPFRVSCSRPTWRSRRTSLASRSTSWPELKREAGIAHGGAAPRGARVDGGTQVLRDPLPSSTSSSSARCYDAEQGDLLRALRALPRR